MRSLIKIMLAAVLVTCSGYASFANKINPDKPAYNTEDRHVSGFNGVAVAGSFDVYIKQGSTESVKVDAPDDIMSRIVTEVKNGVLNIYTKKDGGNWSWGNKKVVIHVTAKNLDNISMSGSGDIFFESGIKANSLRLTVSGSGDISGKVDVQTLESQISGSGDIKVSGRATNSSVKVTGSGDYEGTDVKTVSTAVSVIGSGDASINASTKVQASVIGSGDVHYTGGAKDVSKSKVGSGDISSF